MKNLTKNKASKQNSQADNSATMNSITHSKLNDLDDSSISANNISYLETLKTLSTDVDVFNPKNGQQYYYA